jgi:hypothetical protein
VAELLLLELLFKIAILVGAAEYSYNAAVVRENGAVVRVRATIHSSYQRRVLKVM